MLSADNARAAIQLMLGDSIQVGNPVPFSHGYDNYTGGSAAIANFNDLMAGVGTFAVTGIFGKPNLEVLNLTGQWPSRNSKWIGTSFITVGGGATHRWRGTAVTINDVTLNIDTVTKVITGTLGSYGTFAGNAVHNGITGYWAISDLTLTIATLAKNIFYGKISWGMSNDNLGATNQQILVKSDFDLIGADYVVTLNATETLGTAPVIFDSKQGELTGTASGIYMAGKNNIYFDGYYFPIKPA